MLYYLVLNKEEEYVEFRGQERMLQIRRNPNYIVLNPKQPLNDLIAAAKAAVKLQHGLQR